MRRRARLASRFAAVKVSVPALSVRGARAENGEMSFVFMVMHWPEASRLSSLARSMAEMRDTMLAVPGCEEVDPPYVTDDGTCLVGISRWVSREAFLASGITTRPADEVVEGEVRPRQRFLLHEATI